MSIVTLDIPDELLTRATVAASEQQMSRETFLVAEIAAALQGWEDKKRFLERAERGTGREQEGLELLRRAQGAM